MKTELTIIPIEVSEIASKVSTNKRVEVEQVLNQIFEGTSEWKSQVEAINVVDINDTMSIQLAEIVRKNSKTARLGAEKIFDAKRAEVQNFKAEFDLEDKLWLKAKQIMQLNFKAIEEMAEYKANTVKRFEAEQSEKLVQERILLVSKYAEINRIEFDKMQNDTFESFLNGLKNTYELKIEVEKLAEFERLENERIKQEQAEAQRLENERLKIENDAIQAKALKAKQEAENLQREQQDIINKQNDEIKAKLDAEIKAKQEAEQLFKLSELEAKKLAKAPIYNQMVIWVNTFEIDEIINNDLINNETVISIKQKFESFKNWAKKEIENGIN